MASVTAPVVARHFINRAVEYKALQEAWQSAAAGTGSLVLIEGEAGSGKSRLLAEARKDVARSGAWLAGGLCLHYAAGPFGPISDILRSVARDHPVAFPPAPHLREALRGLVPELTGPFEATTAGDELKSRWLLEGIAETFRRLSAKTPAALAIEDLHWADNGTIDFLRFFAPQLRELRLLIVGTLRDDELAGHETLTAFVGDAGRLGVTEIRVADLSAEDSRRLVASALPERNNVSAETIGRICSIADGHPLFIEELVKHSLEFGSGNREQALPTSIERALQARLKNVEPEDLRILEIAAAIGPSFSADDLSAIAGVTPERALEALLNARNRNLIVERRASGFRFRHELMRQAVYGNALSASMKSVHAAVARLLEASGTATASTLAYHFHEAGEWERARAYAERAGDEAFNDQKAFLDAATQYERALELAGGSALETARLQRKLGRSLSRLGNIDRALESYAKALEASQQAGDQNLHLAILWDRIPDYAKRHGVTGTLELAQEGLLLAQRSGDPQDLVTARTYCAQAAFRQGDVEAARAHLESARSLLPGVPAATASFFHQIDARIPYFTGDWDAWRRSQVNAVEAARSCRDIYAEWNAQYNFAAEALEVGDFAEAARQVTASQALAGTFGMQRSFWLSRIADAELSIYLGEPERARRIVLELAREPIHGAWPAFLAALGLWTAELLGDKELEDEFSDVELLRLAEAAGDAQYYGPLAGAHARMMLREGRRDEAQALLAGAVAMMNDVTCNQQTLVLVAAAGFMLAIPGARTLLAENAARRSNDRARYSLALFDAFQARHESRKGEAARLASEAAVQAKTMKSPALEALANSVGAADPFEAKPKDATLLSKREREVALLAGQGKTNREIAESLGISERTAEQHVSAVLRKSGARSRTELAARFRDGTLHP